jgi:tryptophan-rich sensory protein
MLVVFLALTFGVAFISSRFEPGLWYQHIAKPSWTPPGWIFGPVWSLLYFMMAVAGWLVWRQKGLTAAGLPLGFFVFQLILNGLWSWLFFGRQMIGAALVDLILLWMAILVTTLLFWKVRTSAGVLFIPYLLWVTFAGALNFAIWRLNS